MSDSELVTVTAAGAVGILMAIAAIAGTVMVAALILMLSWNFLIPSLVCLSSFPIITYAQSICAVLILRVIGVSLHGMDN